jgi:hypothetical protein
MAPGGPGAKALGSQSVDVVIKRELKSTPQSLQSDPIPSKIHVLALKAWMVRHKIKIPLGKTGNTIYDKR